MKTTSRGWQQTLGPLLAAFHIWRNCITLEKCDEMIWQSGWKSRRFFSMLLPSYPTPPPTLVSSLTDARNTVTLVDADGAENRFVTSRSSSAPFPKKSSYEKWAREFVGREEEEEEEEFHRPKIVGPREWDLSEKRGMPKNLPPIDKKGPHTHSHTHRDEVADS